MVEIYVAAYVRICRTVGRVIVNAVRHEIRPKGFAHFPASRCRHRAVVVPAVKEQRIVGYGTLGGGVGVDGKEHVEISGLDFFAYFREVAVVFLRVGRSGHVWVRPVLRAGVYNVFLFESVSDEPFANGKRFPQVCVRFVESASVGASGFERSRIGYGSHRTVVRSPASVPGI